MSVCPINPRSDSLSGHQEASEASPKRLRRLQQITCIAIRETACDGLTAHEASLATGVDRVSIQLRISELRRKGLVIPNGKRRRNPSGRTATVWIASESADGNPHSAVPS